MRSDAHFDMKFSHTLDLRLRHGIQALEIHLRLGAGSPLLALPALGSSVGEREEDGVVGSVFGNSDLGAILGFITKEKVFAWQ